MKAKNNKILSYIWTGVLAFWVPLILAAYSVKLIWPVVQKVSAPIARLLPFHNVAGEIADFIIGLLIVVIVTVAAGLLVRETVLRSWAKNIDKLLTKLVPGYSFYKNLLSESQNEEQSNWKSVIVSDNEERKLGFVIENKSGTCTVYIPSAPNPYEGEIIFKAESDLQYIDITFIQAIGIIRRYGKGMPDTGNIG